MEEMINFKEEFDFQLLVITRGRANTEQQVLLKNLHPDIRKQVVIACHPGEKKLHEDLWGDQIGRVVEYEGSHVGEVRHWCIENLDSRFLLFFEDNINLHIRADKPDFGNIRNFGLYENNSDRWNDVNLLNNQVQMILDILIKFSEEEYGMVGFSQRSGNNRGELEFYENQRIFGLWAIDCDLYKQIEFKFSDIDLREDFYVTLGFLLNGYKTGIFYKYAIDKKAGINSKGGCSTYRTQEKTNQNAEMLQEMFPGIVKCVEKDRKNWKGYEGPIKDVHIQWAKAYKIGLGIRKDKENGKF
jgi:hypothetical protein